MYVGSLLHGFYVCAFIFSLQEVVYEKLIGTKMSDLDLC